MTTSQPSLRRTKPLRQRRKESADVEREPKPWAQALVSSTVRPLSRGTMAGGTSGVPVPKGPPAKPGKGAPNAQERRWMAAIVAHGCLPCRMDGFGYVTPEVHHILRGGVRMGHLFTLPLCSGHHRDGAGRPGLIARHPFKERFQERYGDEWALLSTLQGALKLQADGDYAP